MNVRHAVGGLANSIGTKIIFPYFVLTLIVASIGVFIITSLVAGSLQERFENQLLDAGRVVAETMVEYERDRLAVLRAVSNTAGVPEALASGDRQALAGLLPQVIANSNSDTVAGLNADGEVIYSWNAEIGTADLGVELATLPDVAAVLAGEVDSSGDRRVFLADTEAGTKLFTAGPVRVEGEPVGAMLVGMDLHQMARELTETAVARVTFYDEEGRIVETTLAADTPAAAVALEESPQRYRAVTAAPGSQVFFRDVELLNQSYRLAFGDWRLRNQSFGFYSVALPSNFIFSALSTSRTLLSIYFSLATAAVLVLGYAIAQRIIRPLNRLVQISTAVTQGDLDQRTGIERRDEIGTLAHSFDTMTASLVERNRELLEQASKLEAILNSIADGVIVLDQEGHVISSNPVAERILQDVAQERAPDRRDNNHGTRVGEWLREVSESPRAQRYQVGQRVYSALPAPVLTPDAEGIGRVIVMRDITRDVEAETLQNSFITNVSHELRTPLTAVKGYASLLQGSAAESLDAQQRQFVSVIERNTDQLIDHVEKLIDITEIQSGTLQLNRERQRLAPLVKEVVRAWEEKMAAKDLSLHLSVRDADLWLLADRERLLWALDNILSNAYAYTPSGSVTVAVFAAGAEAHVSVTDTGIGIRRADVPHVFSRFFRSENEHSYGAAGMGLGLFIAQAIVERHEGRIRVESELGEGSTFEITLPLLEAEPATIATDDGT